MILDAAGPNFNHGYNNIESGPSHLYEPSIEEEHETSMEEDPNLEYQKFYELLHSADAKLYLDSSLSQLAVISQMLTIKMENNMLQRGFNQMMQLFKESLPEDKLLVDTLKRLYASHTTAADMTWHHEHIKEDGVMRYPSDSEAWKNFNESHPFFADEPRN
ncbi:hypothetical protein P3S68_006914 [Capsicum galapagoense]